MLLRYSAEPVTAVLVADIIRIAFPSAASAVDLTPGQGRFWSERVRIGVSVEVSPHDFTCLPYADRSFDIAVFDPPHLADGGERSIMRSRYGTYRQADLEPTVRAGCREAWRVSRLGVLAKVCDHTHAQRLVWMTGWVTGELGDPSEVIHNQRRAPLVDGKWREPQLSARSNGATYLVFRREPRHLRTRV